jgi:hypothetical protein
MKSLVVGLLGTVLIAGAANAVECSDLPQDVMDKLLIYADSKYPNPSERDRFLDRAIHYTKIEIAIKEAKRRQQQQQQQQPQAK